MSRHSSLASLRRLSIILAIVATGAGCSDAPTAATRQKPTVQRPRFNVDSLSCRSGYVVAHGVVTCKDPQ